MLVDLISHRWFRLTVIAVMGLLAVVGLWNLLQQLFPSDPCLRGTCPRWVTIGDQGLDLCRIVSWRDLPSPAMPQLSSVVVLVQSNGYPQERQFQDKDREVLLFQLSCGQAR